MILPFRISTSPPSFSDRSDDADASYYCDIYEFDHWRSLPIVEDLSKDERLAIVDAGLVGYRVMAADDKEFAILVCVEDDEDGFIYYAIDHRGRVEREPAANEALWHPANTATALPDGYRLERKVGTPSLTLVD